MQPFITRVFSTNRPDLFFVSSEWVFGSPEFLMRAYDSRAKPNPNLSGYMNPEVDKLVDGLVGTSARDELNRACRQIEAIALKDRPVIGLFSRNSLVLSTKGVTGLRINPHNYWNFKDLTLTDK